MRLTLLPSSLCVGRCAGEAGVQDAGVMWLHAGWSALRAVSWSSEAGPHSLILMKQVLDELHAGPRHHPLTRPSNPMQGAQWHQSAAHFLHVLASLHIWSFVSHARR